MDSCYDEMWRVSSDKGTVERNIHIHSVEGGYNYTAEVVLCWSETEEQKASHKGIIKANDYEEAIEDVKAMVGSQLCDWVTQISR